VRIGANERAYIKRDEGGELMPVHAFTSFTYSYLDRARVLARSIRRLHPEWTLWAFVVDCEPEGVTVTWADGEFDHVVRVDALLGEQTERWLFGHDLVEACTALKGPALAHILARADVEAVLYFDPDIALFNPMTELVDDLAHHSIVLTPHITEPEEAWNIQAILDNEAGSLRHGVFNLGFFGVANTPEGRRFARWWGERLADWCVDRPDLGIFVDQKWCDLVPCFFDEVKIIKDPGCNVASWNLSHRRLTFAADGQLRVNDVPLKFYHFTKFGPVGATMAARYVKDSPAIADIWWWYGRQLAAVEGPSVRPGWWHYQEFADGTPISRPMRDLYRTRPDLQLDFPRPFQVGETSFLNWLRHHSTLRVGR